MVSLVEGEENEEPGVNAMPWGLVRSNNTPSDEIFQARWAYHCPFRLPVLSVLLYVTGRLRMAETHLACQTDAFMKYPRILIFEPSE